MRTATKIKIAQTLYRGVSTVRALTGLQNITRVQRDGVWWALDLREGIDFALYLGLFERSTRWALKDIVKAGDTVLDIGANVGAHTLFLGQCAGPQGKVIAFEPTDYAFNKLKANVDLNSALGSTITLEQIMLTASASEPMQQSLYSSWPLTAASDLHERHRGKRMTTPHATAEPLDSYIERRGLQRVDVIKIDVDGHEFKVLSGARECLTRFRPTLVMEFAPYVYKDENSSFEGLIALMQESRYRYRELGSKDLKPLDAAQLRSRIPDGVSLNAILEPT
jgi:FkbM family methyltransferase